MPVPWGKNGGGGFGPQFSADFPVKIRDPKNRAMTLRQLRQLRDFCQRLCKAGLLKYEDDDYNRKLERVGRRVKWTQLTQHEICGLMLMKIIPAEHSCSWVEVVAGGNVQERDFFCSHNWGENFRDFMVSIEAHAKESGISAETKYWICVYANDQHKVELGKELTDSPFYGALKKSQATLLMLDKNAEALLRLWCVFELNETLQRLKQPLQIWTPLGQVGSGLVSSGPIVQALNRIDTGRAAASNPVDQRQILNYLAKVPEIRGITVRSATDKELDESTEGFKRGEYEKRLVAENTAKFNDLNRMVVKQVKKELKKMQKKRNNEDEDEEDERMQKDSEGLFHKGQETTIADHTMRGVTLQQLRDFQQKMKYDFEQKDEGKRTFSVTGKNKETGQDETSERVVEYHSSDMYALEKLYLDNYRLRGFSYVELIAEKEARPEYHIIYGSNMTYKDLMAAIEWHAEARQLPDATVYFLVPWMMDSRDKSIQRAHKCTAPPTRDVLDKHAIGVIMCIDDEAKILTRVNPAWEAYFGISKGLCFDLAAASGALATTAPFANNAWEFGDFDAQLAEMALAFDVATTDGHKNDLVPKLGEIAHGRADHGLKAKEELPKPGQNVQFERLNQRLRQKVAGPVLREAGYSGSTDMILKVLRACPSIEFTHASLKGTLGETGLHTAAGQGHLEVIDSLLFLGSSVNDTDAMGETPLHYAALAGQAEAVKRLLEWKADPRIRSFDVETPLQEATLNPAYFLGVDTTGVLSILEEQKKAAEEREEREVKNNSEVCPVRRADDLEKNLQCGIRPFSVPGGGAPPSAPGPTSLAPDPACRSAIKQVFEASGVTHLQISDLEELLKEVTTLSQQEVDGLLEEIRNSHKTQVQEVDCEWLLDWLAGSGMPAA